MSNAEQPTVDIENIAFCFLPKNQTLKSTKYVHLILKASPLSSNVMKHKKHQILINMHN